MIGEMAIGSIVKGVAEAADELFTSKEEELKLRNEHYAIQARIFEAILENDARRLESINRVNLVEARHPSVFVAGWRPFIGWVCGIALAYTFIAHPLIEWWWVSQQARGALDLNVSPPPKLDLSELLIVLGGLLGLGGFRTFEKLKGVARDTLSSKG